MLGAGQVQRFIAGDQADNFGVAFHQFAFGKGEGAGEADVEADRFQGINAHQAQIEFLFQLAQIHGHGFAVDGVGAFAQQMPVAGHLDQRIVIVRDAFRTFLDLLVGDDVVEHGRRVVDDVADDVSVRTRVNGLGEGPGFYPGLQLRDGDQRQQRHIRATALDGVEQRLVLQVADENMFFMFRQRLVVDAIAGNVNLFRAPEEGELLFNQLFKDVVFLLIVAGHVNRLAKKHRFQQLIVFRL